MRIEQTLSRKEVGGMLIVGLSLITAGASWLWGIPVGMLILGGVLVVMAWACVSN